MESRNPPIPHEQHAKTFKTLNQKATRNANCHGGKSQLTPRQKSQLKFFQKTTKPKTINQKNQT
jgi:hypothetical protein